MVSGVPRGSIMGQMRSGWGGTTLSDLSSPPFISRQPPRATLLPRALPLLWPRYVHLSDYRLHYALFVWCSTYAGINTRYLCTYIPAPRNYSLRHYTSNRKLCASPFPFCELKIKIARKIYISYINRLCIVTNFYKWITLYDLSLSWSKR